MMEFISNEEKQQLLFEFNDTKVDYPKEKTVIDLFEEQVEKTPDAIAVVFEDKELSYRELDDLSTQLYYSLREDYGIEKGDLIGVQLERSEWQIISILGILKSGGVFVPIDSGLPSNRKTFIVEDTDLKLLITETSFMLELDFYKGNVFSIDVEFEPKNGVTSSKIDMLPSDLAYIIYTSGTTGNPKGVMIEYSSLTNYLIWAKKHYLERNLKKANFGLFTSLSFDLTITSLFLPLISGGELRIFGSRLDISYILTNYFQSDLDYIKLTPAHISLLNTLEIEKTTVKVAIVGGDKLESVHVAILKKLNQEIRIYNEYGPTESTVGCTVSEVFSAVEEISIGKPISNTQIFILNGEQELQPVGVIGEICIGGDGLARGYFNKEDLTKDKFVRNPFKENDKIYKTGDLGRWTRDGNIECLGRLDDQVKIRGYRIEIGEVESAISRYEGVEGCAVLVRKNKQGEKDLVAYVIQKKDSKIEATKVHVNPNWYNKEAFIASIRQKLYIDLPNYMMPSEIILLENMPLTSNGKLDRKALLSISEEDYNRKEYIAPRNQIEEKLVSLIAKILNYKESEIGINHNFFDLGMNSLKFINMVNSIKIELDLVISISLLFEFPNVSELSNEIYNLKNTTENKHENTSENFDDLSEIMDDFLNELSS